MRYNSKKIGYKKNKLSKGNKIKKSNSRRRNTTNIRSKKYKGGSGANPVEPIILKAIRMHTNPDIVDAAAEAITAADAAATADADAGADAANNKPYFTIDAFNEYFYSKLVEEEEDESITAPFYKNGEISDYGQKLILMKNKMHYLDKNDDKEITLAELRDFFNDYRAEVKSAELSSIDKVYGCNKQCFDNIKCEPGTCKDKTCKDLNNCDEVFKLTDGELKKT